MCRHCRPEHLRSCYGRGFRVFESYYVVKRLMDRGGIENPWYGVRYAECADCHRPHGVDRSHLPW